jgi:hypothetical protein
MMSQTEFNKACKLIEECLEETIGWRGVSASDLDGGFTRVFRIWSPVDMRLGRPDLGIEIYVNRKSIDFDSYSLTKDEVHAWLQRQFPTLRLQGRQRQSERGNARWG